jgi:hypothetical protein
MSLANIKSNLNTIITEMTKPSLARVEDINSLKQIIDVKNKALKQKFTTEDKVFNGILQKE